MIIINNTIVSDKIADCCFCCDIRQCKGQCCVEGDAGAPLDESELPILEEILPDLLPYMTPEGIQSVTQQGVAVLDNAGELCTPLVNGRECAYTIWGDDGTAFCAIERAYLEGTINFQKPVSCHLYPIRVDDFGEFIAVNYHEWDICHCAVDKGRNIGTPLYIYLKEPLIRRFGEAWYTDLVAQCELYLSAKHNT